MAYTDGNLLEVVAQPDGRLAVVIELTGADEESTRFKSFVGSTTTIEEIGLMAARQIDSLNRANAKVDTLQPGSLDVRLPGVPPAVEPTEEQLERNAFLDDYRLLRTIIRDGVLGDDSAGVKELRDKVTASYKADYLPYILDVA